MAKSKSSRRWLDEHFADPYVKKAQSEGYRSRAAYKLLELHSKDHVLKPGDRVVDLGAAPGGWTQVAKKLVGHSGKVFALDILTMEPLPDVHFIQGDFTTDEVLESLLKMLEKELIDVVISDMAPNMSGLEAVDQPRSMYLAELAFDFVLHSLKPGGVFVSKVFQGAGFDNFYRKIRRCFRQVSIRKPQASRSRSSEVYIVAKSFIKAEMTFD